VTWAYAKRYVGPVEAKQVIWQGCPYDGIAWRPHDLEETIVYSICALGFALLAAGLSWFFLAFASSTLGYALVGRLYHDAYFRRRIRYELSTEGLEIWICGRKTPEREFQLAQLRDLKPQFVTRSGRGTIELPPGGWAAETPWFDRWNRLVPAMYPARRLELIEDVESVAALMRREARRSIRAPRSG
jgi:hypothetical protein